MSKGGLSLFGKGKSEWNAIRNSRRIVTISTKEGLVVIIFSTAPRNDDYDRYNESIQCSNSSSGKWSTKTTSNQYEFLAPGFFLHNHNIAGEQRRRRRSTKASSLATTTAKKGGFQQTNGLAEGLPIFETRKIQ